MARFEMVLEEEYKLALKRLAEKRDCSRARVLRDLIQRAAINEGVWVRAIDQNQPPASVRYGVSSVTR